MHGHLAKIVFAYIGNCLRSRDLPGLEINQEQALFRITPQWSVKIVARADGIELDAVRGKFQGEALGKADSSELCTGVGEILV